MAEVKQEIEKVYDRPVDILAGSKDNEVPDSGKGREITGETFPSARIEIEITEMLKRRPCTALEIAAAVNMNSDQAAEVLKDMVNRGCLIEKIHGGKKYYRTAAGEQIQYE